MVTDARWRKASRCKHKHITGYVASGSCENEPNACGGWSEIHCRDCGVFVTDCYCKYNAGISFASSSFYRTIEKKRRARLRAKAKPPTQAEKEKDDAK